MESENYFHAKFRLHNLSSIHIKFSLIYQPAISLHNNLILCQIKILTNQMKYNVMYTICKIVIKYL